MKKVYDVRVRLCPSNDDHGRAVMHPSEFAAGDTESCASPDDVRLAPKGESRQMGGVALLRYCYWC